MGSVFPCVMKKILFLVMAVLAAASMMIAGCGGGDKKADSQKVLRVGTEPTFAPFEFQKEGSKSYDGFDMDLARAIGKQLGYKVEIVSMGFDALIPALNSGNIDMVAAGMSINDERKQAVTFSDPYYTSGLTILVNKDNTEIKSIKDLEGKRIACQIGTTGEKTARSVAGAKVTAFNTNDEAVMELKNKGDLADFVATIRALGIRIDDIESNPAYLNSGLSVFTVSFTVSSAELKQYKKHGEIIEALRSLDYVYYIEEMN